MFFRYLSGKEPANYDITAAHSQLGEILPILKGISELLESITADQRQQYMKRRLNTAAAEKTTISGPLIPPRSPLGNFSGVKLTATIKKYPEMPMIKSLSDR